METLESSENEVVCCPRFDPAPWEDRMHRWNEKRFVVDSIPQFLHMPLPWMLRRLVARLWGKATEQGAAPPLSDFLMLANDPSPWKSDIYIAVDKEVEGVRNTTLSGSFFSKVFDGPYSAVPKYVSQVNQALAAKGTKARNYYFYFTTCPKCAKKYGHNYIVAFAET